MFKPLTAQLNERFGGSPLTPTLNPQTVARSFGVAIEVGEPLHESATQIRHVEDDQASAVLLDTKKTPAPKSEPTPLIVIASTRLRSIKPRTKARAKQVAQLIADSQEYLVAIDEMVRILKQEQEEAIHARWEDLKTRGRALRTRVTELQGAYHSAQQNANAGEIEKGRAKSRVDAEQNQRRSIYKDKFATTQRKESADAKVKNAARELMAASDAALKGQQALGEAYNAWKLAQSELLGVEIACDQCAAELAGQPYHDPTTGLSIQPAGHLQA